MRAAGLVLVGALLCLAFHFQVVQAQTYSWVDEEGRVHFADDLTKVPEKYKGVATPVGPTRERAKEMEPSWMRPSENQTRKDPESETKPVEKDLLEELVKEFPGLSYEWTQDMSVWVKVPANMAHRKEELSEMACKIASYYHQKKGHLVCVRFYYGPGKVIARECR